MQNALAPIGLRLGPLLLILLLPVPAVAEELAAPPSASGAAGLSGDAQEPSPPPSAGDSTGPAASPRQEEPEPREDEDGDAVRIEWRDGLRATSRDGRFLLRLGGRIHLDSAFFDDDMPFDGRGGAVEDAVEIRRLRVDVRGHVYDRLEYRAQVELAGGDAQPKDVWMGIRGLPTTLRFGHLKEPFSLEELTSSNHAMFVERSLMNVLAPSRNVGAYASGSLRGDRVHWAAGAFRETDGFGAGAGAAGFTGRVTATPVRSPDDRRLLHLGVGVTHRELDGALRVRVRPEVHLAPRVLDVTGAADSADQIGLELGGNVGSLTAAAEYTRASFDAAGDPTVDGFYVSAGYFLTGETRAHSGTAWQRVRPRRNFLDGSGGPGAVMVGARYSRIDLGEVTTEPGSELSGLTFGLSWHWNPGARLLLNWVRTELEGVDEASMLSLRMQLAL